MFNLLVKEFFLFGKRVNLLAGAKCFALKEVEKVDERYGVRVERQLTLLGHAEPSIVHSIIVVVVEIYVTEVFLESESERCRQKFFLLI